MSGMRVARCPRDLVWKLTECTTFETDENCYTNALIFGNDEYCYTGALTLLLEIVL